MNLDHLAVLTQESRRLRDVLAGVDPTTPVPTCPGWTAADLLHHVAEVHRTFAEIITSGTRSDAEADAIEAEAAAAARTVDGPAVAAAELHRVLSTRPADEPCWMWTADPALHTIGYVRRRMAHETLVHRVDAELTAGRARTEVDPLVAADGVDEVLRVFFGGPPSWAQVDVEPAVVRVTCTDAAAQWFLRPATVHGTPPGGGEPVSEPGLQVLAAPPADGAVAATVHGPALDVVLWWWNRPATVVLSGDVDVLATLEQMRTDGIT